MTSRINLGLDRFSGLYLWALFIIVFSVMAPLTFPTMSTVHLLASTQAIAGIAALGLLVAMVSGQFDLSIGAVANFAGVLAVILQTKQGVDAGTAVVVGIVAGGLIGFVNGFIVVKLRVNSFIATLGMTSVLAALQVVVTNNEEPLPPESAFFSSITQTDLFGFQMVVLYLVVLAFFLWWLLEKTPVGRYMYAVGSNPDAARLSGLPVDRFAWIALTASGTISGLAGVLFVSLTGPSLGFGASLLLPAFAAVFLGSTQLKPGKENVWGTLLSIFVLATGVQGLQLVSGVSWVAALFNGVALIAAVALAAGRERRSRSSRRQRETKAAPPPPPADTGAEQSGNAVATATSPNR
ncbi:ABC transporter permease [Geodermatophilus sp. CPCC 205506]|uniref:ABC transporter permease n=1 Tax=Geodermatophilus sp. CPCC 205506 TaxID=2936596 RepID=UPI003EEFD5CE